IDIGYKGFYKVCRFVHQHSAEIRNSLHGLAYLFSGCVSKLKNLNIELYTTIPESSYSMFKFL
ncbi:MAG: hypothetical protein QX203_07435, partial [Methylococcaceae bacterium]